MGDLAAFFRAVFSGGIFEDPSTVDTMLSTLEVERAGPDYFGSELRVGEYRMGVTVTEMGGYTIYRHGGFYGTMAAYVPELDLAIGATVNRTESGDELYSMVGVRSRRWLATSHRRPWIDRRAVDHDLVVEVESRGVAAFANLADHLAGGHPLALFDCNLLEVRVPGANPVAVIDDHRSPVVAQTFGDHHLTGGGGPDRRSLRGGEIDALVP